MIDYKNSSGDSREQQTAEGQRHGPAPERLQKEPPGACRPVSFAARRLCGGDAAQVFEEVFRRLQTANALRAIDEVLLEAGALFGQQLAHPIAVDIIELVYLIMVHCD